MLSSFVVINQRPLQRGKGKRMKQAEKIYLISDAAKQVNVEAHVLRYWEEELDIPAKRNELGHRYYTQEDIETFRKVKELKAQGIQLKGIKNILKNGALAPQTGEAEEGKQPQKPEEACQGDMELRQVVMVKKGEFLPVTDKGFGVREEGREQKSLRLQQLLREMIAEAVSEHDQTLFTDMKESLLKELDYRFRLQEEKEEEREKERVKRQDEHYRQVDELLRAYSQKKKRSLFTIKKKEEKKRSIV